MGQTVLLKKCICKSHFYRTCFITFIGKCSHGINGVQLLSCKVCLSLAPSEFYSAINPYADVWGSHTLIGLPQYWNTGLAREVRCTVRGGVGAATTGKKLCGSRKSYVGRKKPGENKQTQNYHFRNTNKQFLCFSLFFFPLSSPASWRKYFCKMA